MSRTKSTESPIQTQPSPGSLIPTVSLFSGSGGLDQGLARWGFSPAIAFDVNDSACQTFQYNHPLSRVIRRDLSKLPPGYVVERVAEIPGGMKPAGVVGGPPCQAFSLGNVHKSNSDPRRRLPATYARILGELRKAFDIDFFVFENVLGLRHKAHEVLYSGLKALLEEAGFKIFVGELDAKEFGVPQTRQRVFIVGFNKRKYPKIKFAFPLRTFIAPRTVRDVLAGLPAPTVFARGLTPETIPFHPNHWCMRPVSKRFSNGELSKSGIRGRPFRVLHWDRPSWTVAYGNREVHIHPLGKRRLSVYEAMLLQGFPPSYRLLGTLSDQIRMVSDAVPPPVGEVLGQEILRAIATATIGPRTEQEPERRKKE